MELISLIIIFILALFIGYEIITKVPPTLHTPLMSGSNAISRSSNCRSNNNCFKYSLAP